ncbi:MAG TPA: ATP-binding protein [Acidimicrobiales bacterium]|nr:ATP-binding protein [Acidimicrobiales bacterium]
MAGQTPDRRNGWAGLQVRGNGTAADAVTDLLNILDSIELPVVVIQRDLTMVAFNQAAADTLGVSPVDLGRNPRDISALAGLPALDRCCSDVMASGVESRIDIRDKRAWFVVRIFPYRRGDGQGAGTVLTFTDVTAFRASVDQAVYERECTRAILNTVADPLAVLDADQRIQSGNRSFYTMFDVSPDEAQRTSLYELGKGAFNSEPLHTQLQAAVAALSIEKLIEVLADGHAFQPVEVDHVVTAKGERTLIVEFRPLSLPGHSEGRALVRFQDITSRKQAEAAKDQRSEKELRRSEAFLAEGQRLSSTGSFSWKVVTDEIMWSEELYRIYELEIGLPVTLEMIRARVHPEDLTSVETIFERARGGMNDLEWQYRLQMPDRSIKYLHAIAHASRDQDGQLEYIAAIQDVTAPRLSEEALARARSELANVSRMSSLGMLTASIAHEVNQPLAGIITNAGTCLRMLDATPPNLEGARETARRTIRDGIRGSDVIARLRALFSKDEFTLEPLDLSEVTREVIALTLSDLQRTRVTLRSELAEDLPSATGDRVQLQQVILNLLRNASDAMADVRDRPRQILIKTERDDGEWVRLSVRDSGVGVDPASINKLLEAFYTTKSDGMGIGLSISRSIIERHHGRLWAEQNDGPGATFSFSVPSERSSVPDALSR